MKHVSLISYSNALPFRFALENLQKTYKTLQIHSHFPFQSFDMLRSGKVDLAIAPVKSLSLLPSDYHVYTNFCIKSQKAVKTVMLYSEVPVEKIESILLDYQSLSSNSLLQVLMKFYWKKKVRYLKTSPGYEIKVSGKTAGIIIGDRNTQVHKTFPYAYDLATEWYNFSGRPFVFAAWIGKGIGAEIETALNQQFQEAVENIDKVVDFYIDETSPENERTKLYLKENITYQLLPSDNKTIEMFLHYCKIIEQEA